MTNPNNEAFANHRYPYQDGLKKIEKLARDKGSILYAVNERGRTLSAQEPEEFAIISSLVLQLERKDEYSGVYADPSMQTSKAALKGAMTGLLVAEAAFGDDITTNEILAAINIKDAIGSGDEDVRRAVNDAMADISGAALERMESAEQLISEWEDVCVDDLSYHHCYRIGFGLVMGSASRAVYDKRLEELRIRVETGVFDWDQDLNDLLDSEK